MQIVAIVVSLAFTAVALVMTALAVRSMVGTMRIGGPALNRTDQPARRTWTMVKETLGHTRMLQWTFVGIMHWFVYAGFIVLSSAVATGYVQLFNPDFALPIIGHWFLFEWVSEALGTLSAVGIIALIIYRQLHHPRREGRSSRFFGSNFWQAYFVEAMVLLEGSAILFIRGAEYNLGKLSSDHPEDFDRFHFPISSFVGDALFPTVAGSEQSLETIIVVIAMVKIVLAMVWLMVISANLTMGVAWHRFTAWPNIWFKREGSGRTALGAMKPLTSGGKAITLDDIDDLDEDATLGVGSIEDYSWKGILDFTTCTECGRCQSQCPAWNTEKPLSPKLLITAMRDHAYAKAPYSRAGGEGSEAATALLENDEQLAREVARPLVGDTGDDWFYMPENGSAVIDPDVLWSCTNCGACVQQCPVDIEHVDHIEDMRRYQVLVESNFPAELNGLFKGLENKGNPWNMSPNARMDWAKGLDFEVKVVGETVESLDEVDWLFWVGCAGAYEDRAKKTTRAVAELLDIAGVSFGVLGNGETCTGDPARRAGNEFVFQGLAQQNVETFREYKVKKVVSTCAHCFNTLKNEYKEFGVELEVVHHTQLLNRLVREGRLTPVKDGAGAHKRSITYHDPCFVGRHNGVYSPPRELLEILPGAEYVEMERNSERSFCCGAGGARMWMEENLGERININRTVEAVGTGADQIAVGCPFCRVMLSDGLTAQQAKGEAREEVEVLDVAQMLLASVKGEVATKVMPGERVGAAVGAGAAAGAATAKAGQPVETKAEPAAGDQTVTEDTVTETADAGPAAKASGGSSLFDTPAESETATDDKPVAEEAEAAKPASSGGSLFDLGGDEAAAPAAQEPAPASEPTEAAAEPAAKADADLGTGGSLFDLGGEEPATESKPEPAAESATEPTADQATPAPADEPAKATAGPEADLGSGGSLFDLAAPEPEAPAAKTSPAPADEPSPAEAETPTTEESAASTTEKPASAPATEIPEGGSLFDLAAPEPAAPAEPAAPVADPEPAEAEAEDAAAEAEHEAEDAEPSEAKAEPVEAPEAEATLASTDKVVREPAAASGATSTPVSDVDLDGLGSLFDLEAPETTEATSAPVAEPTAEPAAAPTAEPTVEPAAEAVQPAEPATEQPSGEEVSAAATAIAGGTPPDADVAPETAPEAEAAGETSPEAEPDATTDVPAEPAADDEPQPEAQPEAGSEPAEEKPASGSAHTPRTDVEISEDGSLFDL